MSGEGTEAVTTRDAVTARPVAPPTVVAPPTGARRSRARRRVGPLVWAALAVLVVALLWAIVPGLFASADPLAISPSEALQGPSSRHVFGTDESGRDVYARIVHGARDSMFLGVVATTIAVTLGGALGLLAGLGGRWTDTIVSRVVEVMFSFPALLLALLVIVTFGASLVMTTVAIGIALSPALARLVRAETLLVRESGYVEAARLLGHGRRRVIVATITPNVARPLLSFALLQVGAALIWGMTLNFLGFGARPPHPSWGGMLAASQDFLTYCWWLAVFPGAAVALVAASAMVIGRHLQARLAGRNA